MKDLKNINPNNIKNTTPLSLIRRKPRLTTRRIVALQIIMDGQNYETNPC
jgi:hypothetical protein